VIALFLLLVVIIGTVVLPPIWNNRNIAQCLRDNRINEARSLMQESHQMQRVISLLDGDKASLQRALEVQFEYHYENDTNFWYREDLPAIQFLVQQGVQVEYNHLLKAAQQGKMTTVAYFMDLGVPIEAKESIGNPLSDVAYWGDVKLLHRMLEKTTDVNRGDMPPLLSAAWSGQVACVRLLLKHGADPAAPCSPWAGDASMPVWTVIRDGATPPAGPEMQEVWALVADHMKAK
jgi:ankyrin repeat protein